MLAAKGPGCSTTRLRLTGWGSWEPLLLRFFQLLAEHEVLQSLIVQV